MNRKIDISGPKGNALVLMGIAHRIDPEIANQMQQAGSYENLLRVFKRDTGIQPVSPHLLPYPDDTYEIDDCLTEYM